jgi:signal transduction histidine kinase
MNRLWVRISLTMAIIVIFLVIIPIGLEIAFTEFSYYEGEPDFEFFPGYFLITELIFPMGITVIVSIAAGILVSRSLTAPLSRLAEAARAIGQRNLDQRVEEKGSRELKELAAAFNQMATDLDQAESLRSNLLADVAHELRTPLSVLQGNLRAILDDVYQLDKKEIARLYDQTRHLTALVEDLRELAQAEANQLPLNIESLVLSSLVSEVIDAFRPAAEESNLDLRAQLDPNLPRVLADRQRLTQILHNLLNNALVHSKPGGEVHITAQVHDDGIQLSIADQGQGISAEDLPRVFDRFYRADQARDRDSGGAGLGLAIVKALAEAQGAKVGAQSLGQDQGTTFWIWLKTE